MENQKGKGAILGLNIWRIFAYFIIYSILGYIIETLYGIATKGVWESRQSFLYGPFCAIYGIGASIMLIFLHKCAKKYNVLFIGGFILGSIIEYTVSLIGEMILHVKWWDYSHMPLNINGRICVFFSLFWGFLAVYLVASLNPKIDRLIDYIKRKISVKGLKVLTLSAFTLLIIDCIVTGFAMSLFITRMVAKNNINVVDKDYLIQRYEKIYNNKKYADFIYKYWGDKKMIRTFPNIKLQDIDGNIIFLDSLVDIQPYYMEIDLRHKFFKKNKTEEDYFQ